MKLSAHATLLAALLTSAAAPSAALGWEGEVSAFSLWDIRGCPAGPSIDIRWEQEAACQNLSHPGAKSMRLTTKSARCSLEIFGARDCGGSKSWSSHWRREGECYEPRRGETWHSFRIVCADGITGDTHFHGGGDTTVNGKDVKGKGKMRTG